MARVSLQHELAYIAIFNRQAARRMKQRVTEEIRQLKQFPEMGRIGEMAGTRISGDRYALYCDLLYEKT